MNLQSILNSPAGLLTAFALAKLTPPAAGYPLARRLAGQVAARKDSSLVRAVRANQWVARGERLPAAELDQAVLETFRHTGRCLYDFYHFLGNTPAMERMVRLGPGIEAALERGRTAQEGTILVIPHLSNFDLVGQVLIKFGVPIQFLTFTNPPAGYRLQNLLRRNAGLEITPISTGALRQASERLRHNGVILTGLDRPLPGLKTALKFFGRPAYLPIGHIRLALKENVPVIVTAIQTQADGTYLLSASEPVYMQRCNDRETEIVANAEAVLKLTEAYIRQAPHQWAMYYPVWPDVQVQPE